MTTHAELVKLLRQWRNFEECLLEEVRFLNGLYTAELVFNYVWSADGRVREQILEEPLHVTLRLVGLEELRFVGALTRGMRSAPERIDWGLSEVAMVRAVDRGDFVGLSVNWESERSFNATFVSFDLIESSHK